MPLKQEYSMPSKIVPFKQRAEHATKHDHLDSLEPKIGWKVGILLTVVGLVAFILAGQFIAWCEAHASLIIWALLITLTFILINGWLKRVPLSDLSQELHPSTSTRW